MRRHSWWAVASVFALAVSSCSSPSATVQIHLSTVRAEAGQPINGTLVVNNPQSAFFLTPKGCVPPFVVILTRGHFRNDVVIPLACSERSVQVSHGTTRLPFTVTTSYNSCLGSGGYGDDGTPHCLPTGGDPPLPTGSYKAVLEWFTRVPLPTPTPVPIDLK